MCVFRKVMIRLSWPVVPLSGLERLTATLEGPPTLRVMMTTFMSAPAAPQYRTCQTNISIVPSLDRSWSVLVPTDTGRIHPKTGGKGGIGHRIGGGQIHRRLHPVVTSSSHWGGAFPPRTDPERIWTPSTPDGYTPQTGKQTGIARRIGGGRHDDCKRQIIFLSETLAGPMCTCVSVYRREKKFTTVIYFLVLTFPQILDIAWLRKGECHICICVSHTVDLIFKIFFLLILNRKSSTCWLIKTHFLNDVCVMYLKTPFQIHSTRFIKKTTCLGWTNSMWESPTSCPHPIL